MKEGMGNLVSDLPESVSSTHEVVNPLVHKCCFHRSGTVERGEGPIA